jgi:hypothetical protein
LGGMVEIPTNDTPSAITPSNINYENSEETTPYYEQIVNCNLGICGAKELTRDQCSTYVCCKVGSSYSVAFSQTSCTAQQQAYIESITPPAPTYYPPSYNTTTTTCCKVCNKGKACGDSCINRSYTCHQPPGCACDG